MTIGEYVSSLLEGVNLSESAFLSVGLDKEAELDLGSLEAKKGIVDVIGMAIMTPYLKTINENGFSVSYDRTKLGNLYAWLCRKWGIKPDDDIIPVIGVSAIVDKTDTW